MISNNQQRVVFQVIGTGKPGCRTNQVLKQVNIIVTVHALHNRRHALHSHAGIYGRMRQGMQLTLGIAVVLHEHQVPDLDVAVAVLFRGAGRAAGHLRPVVKKDFGTGTTGAGVPH